MNTTESYGIGLIGCGAFGMFCMNAYNSLEGVKPRAVADIRKEAAEEIADAFDIPAFGDPADMIARDDVDIVHIATPPSSHHDLALKALKAGKHVLCEKPLAMNLAEADAMLQAAGDSLLMPVNFVLRYNLVTDAVKAVLESGVLGKVLSARVTNCASDCKLGPDHWFWDRSVSGGIFIEHGVHFFDLYRYWLGEGQVISSHTETRENTDQEDRVMCTIRHDTGAVSSHYHGFDQPGPMDRTDHRLVLELGDIRVEGWIPLTLTIHAVLDDDGLETIRSLLPSADIQVLEEFDAGEQNSISRGKPRHLAKRVQVYSCPQPDKQSVYAESTRALLADQIASLRDRNHSRTVTEANGRAALAWAEAAKTMAESS